MYIEQGTASRTLTQTCNRNKEPPCGPWFKYYYAPHATQLWLKPMTRKHLATSKASTRAIPKRQERSRRTDILVLLVLREKEVRYCLREGQPAVCPSVCGSVSERTTRATTRINGSSGEASDYKIKIHSIIDTKPSRRLSAVGFAYTCNWYLLYNIYDEFWVESRYDMDLWRCSCSAGRWRIHRRRCSDAVYGQLN